MSTITIEKTVTTVEKVPVEIKLPYYAKGAGVTNTGYYLCVYGKGNMDAIQVLSNINGVGNCYASEAFEKDFTECSEAEFVEAFNKANSHIHSIIQEKILVAV